MLAAVGVASTEELLREAVPASILMETAPALPPLPDGKGDGTALDEVGVLEILQEFASRTPAVKSMLGLGYYRSHMPAPIRHLILQNPSWYTAYTPYQAEISQGRLEMILNFQTLVADLCGLPMANASLLDEATAVAEAMTLLKRACKQAHNRFLVDVDINPQTLDVLQTRAQSLGIEISLCASDADFEPTGAFGALHGYPTASGAVRDASGLIDNLAAKGVPSAVCTDLLPLCLLRSPGSMGASVVVGSSQRFGLPLGAGGPHAAFMAFKGELARLVPGRIVGISRDQAGRNALRLALQTREQHIRRDKATSNICTAQVLPAVLAAAFAIYHGPAGLVTIAMHCHVQACKIANAAKAAGLRLANDSFFDTLRIQVTDPATVVGKARKLGIALLELEDGVGLSCDETTTDTDVASVLEALGIAVGEGREEVLPQQLRRTGKILLQRVFHRHHSEHGFMRYLQRLARKDIALDRSMIPLGSCTMKLNAATEMTVLNWPGFADIHPFAPEEDRVAINIIAEDLGEMLCCVTGFEGISLQPNAGSQGEYAGLLAIKKYHLAHGDTERDVCLIPASAHGTNPASAALAGMEIIEVKIDAAGGVDLADLESKAASVPGRVAALMITYPSTCGVYGPQIREICNLVHAHGGQVYMDGANLNAMVCVAQPGAFGADVMHINLHKTFCIPHGGGGPGMGPIVCKTHLIPHLPGHNMGVVGKDNSGAVSAAPLGSGLLLLISWAYMRLMGGPGLRSATAVAVLASNYMAKRLGSAYDVMYAGSNGRVAHEFILDTRNFKKSAGVTVEDIAKRLIDMGFHAPTISFPLAGVVMIEPTESESLDEIDRYCDAMLAIRQEIARIEKGEWQQGSTPLNGAPHVAEDLLAAESALPYDRTLAAYPLPFVRQDKYWPPISRVDQVFGDRNLVCVLEPGDEL